MMDPLAPLLKLPDVESAVKNARTAVDAAYRHPALRREGGQVAAEIGLRSAVASASLQTSDEYQLELVRSGTVLDAVVQSALRVSAALPDLAPRWETAPRQVLAKLHVLAGTGILPADDLGRPGVPLDRVCAYVTDKSGDPLIRAAVIHGEILALDAFEGVNGLMARAASRLTLVASGFDPRGILAVEDIHHSRAPEYLGSARAFATGTRDGIRSWLKHVALAAALGAQLTETIARAKQRAAAPPLKPVSSQGRS